MQFDDVLAIFAALDRFEVEYVLVGGVAVGLHGFERATNDVDLFVRPTSENVAHLRDALRSVYQDASIGEISAEDLAGDYPTIRYGPPTGDFFIDLLGRLGSAVAFDDLEWETMNVAGVRVRVATPRTLFRMKRGTVRAVDRIDAEVLKEAFGLDEEG
ncbi:MAG: nucleotidyl transferase AbiEii/AbiGii toxin family protein [Thermoanaerobaculia bacterium]